MNTFRCQFVVAALAPLALISIASAAVIDFETTSVGGVPVDDSNATGFFFDGPTGVRFGFDTNNDLVQDAPAHFESRVNGNDSPAAGYTSGSSTLPNDSDTDLSPTNEGGSWMLREPKNQESPDASLFTGGDWFLIQYSGVLPTSCSGEIWDVDNGEQYRVDAYDASDVLIATYFPPIGLDPDLPGSRNGLGTTFAFSGLSSPIAKIAISLSVTTAGGGFGFDNFNATQAPAPGALVVMGIGSVLGMRRRR